MASFGRANWVVVGAVLGLVIALAVPALGNPHDRGGGDVTAYIAVSGETGNLGAEWSGGHNAMWISGQNPDGGQYGGAFDCQFWGEEDVMMPTYKRLGIDKVKISLEVPWTEFDYCVGDYPDVITYEVEFVVDNVLQTIDREQRNVLKGEGFERNVTSVRLSGYGSGDGFISGTIQGQQVEGWGAGSYSFFRYIEGGPPMPDLEP